VARDDLWLVVHATSSAPNASARSSPLWSALQGSTACCGDDWNRPADEAFIADCDARLVTAN